MPDPAPTRTLAAAPAAGVQRPVTAVRRLLCRLFGHDLRFPYRDVFAPLTCRRCPWEGP